MRKLLEFHRSPNAVKVRIGLNFKKLEYETEEMMAADRRPMREAAGWPMIPILIDGDVVVRDSMAILHYLESNYLDRPSLTPLERDDILTAEALLANLNPEILRIQWSLGPQIDRPEDDRNREWIARTRRRLTNSLEKLEHRLAEREWIVCESMSMYDIVLACNLLPARAPRRFARESPLWRFFQDHFELEGRPQVADWMDRVLIHDGLSRA